VRRMKEKWERVLAQIEYRRARRSLRGSVASTLPDGDTGVHIRGVKSSEEDPLYIRGPEPSWGNRAGDYVDNPVETSFGRRHTDVYMDKIATKKLVVIAVFVVEVVCLAGDTFFLRGSSCP